MFPALITHFLSNYTYWTDQYCFVTQHILWFVFLHSLANQTLFLTQSGFVPKLFCCLPTTVIFIAEKVYKLYTRIFIFMNRFLLLHKPDICSLHSWNINWLFQHCQIKMTPYPIRKRVCSNKQPNKYLSSNRLYAYLTFIQSGRVIEIFAAFQNEHEFPDSVVCSGLSQIPSSSTAW